MIAAVHKPVTKFDTWQEARIIVDFHHREHHGHHPAEGSVVKAVGILIKLVRNKTQDLRECLIKM